MAVEFEVQGQGIPICQASGEGLLLHHKIVGASNAETEKMC